MTVGAIVAQLRLDMTNFREGLDKANSLLAQHGQQASQAAGMLGAFAAAAAGAIAIALRWSSEFEAQMRNVNSILQETEPNFRALSESVLGLAGETGQGPEILARGLYDIASSGFAGADGLKVLEAAAKAATAGISTTAVASQAITAVLNAYGMNADQAGKVSDILFKTVDRGVITFDQLAQNIGDVVSIAATANVPFEQMGAAIAAMTKAGITPAEAFTALNMVVRSIILPTAEAKAAAEKLGITMDATALASKGLGGVFANLSQILKTNTRDIDAMRAAGATEAQVMAAVAQNAGVTTTELGALFPEVRALKGALVLASQGGKTFATELEQMSGATGATSRALAQQSKSFAVSWNKTWASIRASAIEAAQDLLPALTQLTEGLRLGVEAVRGIPRPVQVAAVAAVALAGGFAALAASLILYSTQLKPAIPLTLGMISALRQLLVSAATTQVALGGVSGAAGMAASGLKSLYTSAAAAQGAVTRGQMVYGALFAVMLKVGVSAVQASSDVDDFNLSLSKLEDRAQKARAAMQRFPEGLKLTWWQAFLQHLTPVEGEITKLRNQQLLLFAGATEMAEKRAAAEANTAQEIEAARTRLKGLDEGETRQQLADIEALRLARIKAGWDAALAGRVAAEDRRNVEQQATADSLKMEAEIAQAQGRTHEAKMASINAEALEWAAANEKRLGKEKAAAAAERRKSAQILALDREEAEARAKAFAESAGQIISSWTQAAESMRQADQLSTAEYLGQLSQALDLIRQVNAARAASGQSQLFGQEELRLAQTIFTERQRMQRELETGEKRLADERKQWAQEELAERQRLHDYELSLLDLTFQHQRDLAKLSGDDDAESTARLAQQELAALQQRRESEQLSAKERLDSLERERQLLLQIAEAGVLPQGDAAAALAGIFAEMESAQVAVAAQDATAFEARRKEHQATLDQVQTEQQSLRDQLSQTAGAVVNVAQSVFDVLETRLRALASIRLEPAAAGALPGAAGRTFNFYLNGQKTGGANIGQIADQLAELLEREVTYARQ